MIQDIKPPSDDTFDTVPEPAKPSRAQMLPVDANYIEHVDGRLMIAELYARGVTVEDIFGVYYELEEMGNARSDQAFGSDEQGQHGRMTVADAEVSGLAPTVVNPKNERQPF